MDGVERRRELWKNLKQRLRFKGTGFCGGPSWALRVSDIPVEQEQETAHQEPVTGGVGQIPSAEHLPTPPCATQTPATPGMNLAAALAAERHSREVDPTTETSPGAALKPLMRLFEETDGLDVEKGNRDKEGGGGIVSLCCVCMERSKGAAFIPCGHTYCRECARELWLNRGYCPLCNRLIIEILDIF